MGNSRILIVEDQNIIAMDLKNRLTTMGYVVLATVADGEEAVAKAEEIRPDLVLMDIVLKGSMDGVQAAEQIQARCNLPVIYLTAHSDEQTLQRATLTEPYGYILKPFEDRELHMAIEMALYKHRIETRLKEQGRWLAATLRSIGDAVIATDAGMRVKLVNPVAESLTGWTQAEALGRELSEVFQIISGKMRAPGTGPLVQALQENVTIGLGGQTTLVSRGGKEIPIDNGAAPILDEQGNMAGVVLVFHDIAERRRAEEKMRLAAKVFESAAEGIMITNADIRIVAVNEAFTATTGYESDEVLGKTPNLLKSGKHDDEFYRALWKSLNETGQWKGEIWNRRKNGELYPQWLSINAVRDAKGAVANYVGMFTDITARKQAEERLRVLAYHDPLTGLPNRALFHTLLSQALAKAQRHHRLGAVLFIDLDRFKNINDTLGHPVGDLLLKEAATRLMACLRQSDTIARLGGDEFTILLEEIAHERDAIIVAQKILAALAEPFNLAGHEVFVTASIGISLFPHDGNDVEALLKNADTALYRTKEQGRNGYTLYTAEMNALALKRMALENSLRRAVERSEFLLHYQPRVALDTGRVICVEALLRWQHPELGLVMPDQFISLAEETGLIMPVGEWVLRTACAQAKAWQASGFPALRVSVNLSARQFSQPGIVAQVAKALSDAGLAPNSLELELTESTVMQDAEDAIAKLNALKQLGVYLSIDDFGAGYSSLEYLKHFPIDTLKIDRSFVQDVPGNSDDGAIVRAIIAMAHSLKIKVTAEGVETAEQLGFLRAYQCDEMQGYYFGMPLPTHEFLKLF